MPTSEGQALLPGFPVPPAPRGLDCVITVQGNGTGRGSPRRDRTGPVHGFLTDLSGYYREVLKHVTACGRCSSNEVLRRYLERRESLPKFRGRTSKGLCDLALKYESKDPSVDRRLVDEFFVRHGDWAVLCSRPGMDEDRLARGLRAVWEEWRFRKIVPERDATRRLAEREGLLRSPLLPAVEAMAREARRRRREFPEEEVLTALRVGLVMLS